MQSRQSKPYFFIFILLLSLEYSKSDCSLPRLSEATEKRSPKSVSTCFIMPSTVTFAGFATGSVPSERYSSPSGLPLSSEDETMYPIPL